MYKTKKKKLLARMLGIGKGLFCRVCTSCFLPLTDKRPRQSDERFNVSEHETELFENRIRLIFQELFTD